MINGIINVYKEKDYTSHDVVARLRGILKQKKIGHTGTLDPEAQGVLPVCLGNGTKLCGMLTDEKKEYVAEFLLGVTTDTQDMTGNVLSEKSVDITEKEAEGIILSFLGEYDQIPPMYSACKINGKRLYELAREGKEVERKARKVWIEELEILSMQIPDIKIRVVCSKGTYIRTLCHDIGEKAGCGAAMKTLLRTRVGKFELKNAFYLDEIERQVKECSDIKSLKGILWQSVDSVFADYPALWVKDGEEKTVQNGNPLFFRQITGKTGWVDKEWARVYDRKENFYGIYEFDIFRGCFKPVKMFLEQ